jgi:general secretion pathway protein A
MESTLFRPVLLIDEAQEALNNVFAEIRLLSSVNFDSRSILTVVLGGDNRLLERLRTEELLPLFSRVRARLVLDALTPKELMDYVQHSLAQAGNPKLMTPELMTTLCEHSLGNLRVLTQTADDMLRVAAERELPQLDQKLYLELFTPTKSDRARVKSAVRA